MCHMKIYGWYNAYGKCISRSFNLRSMETTTHNNKLSSVLQKIDIMHCFMPAIRKSKRGICCSVFLLSILLSILQTIISANKRMRIPYPRGDGGLSLFTFRLILYQRGRKRRKRRKVGLNSPPRSSPQKTSQFSKFSQKSSDWDILCCLYKMRQGGVYVKH